MKFTKLKEKILASEFDERTKVLKFIETIEIELEGLKKYSKNVNAVQVYKNGLNFAITNMEDKLKEFA